VIKDFLCLQLCELPFETVQLTDLCPAIGMRSAGQILAVRLLDRKMWSCVESETKVRPVTEL
jgi:hypothetical protein